MGVQLREHKFGVLSLVINPAVVATITTAEQTFTLAGLKLGDFVAVSKPSVSAGLGVCSARVSAADTLAITFVNPSAAGVDAASETWLVLWVRPEAAATAVQD